MYWFLLSSLEQFGQPLVQDGQSERPRLVPTVVGERPSIGRCERPVPHMSIFAQNLSKGYCLIFKYSGVRRAWWGHLMLTRSTLYPNLFVILSPGKRLAPRACPWVTIAILGVAESTVAPPTVFLSVEGDCGLSPAVFSHLMLYWSGSVVRDSVTHRAPVHWHGWWHCHRPCCCYTIPACKLYLNCWSSSVVCLKLTYRYLLLTCRWACDQSLLLFHLTCRGWFCVPPCLQVIIDLWH